MITVVETPAFTRQAEKLLTEEERKTLIDHLAANPTGGDEIPGLRGIRKLRFALKSKGKSGGARVIYFYMDDAAPLHAMLLYGKGEQTDLYGKGEQTDVTPEQRKAAKAFVDAIKLQRSRKRKGR